MPLLHSTATRCLPATFTPSVFEALLHQAKKSGRTRFLNGGTTYQVLEANEEEGRGTETLLLSVCWDAQNAASPPCRRAQCSALATRGAQAMGVMATKHGCSSCMEEHSESHREGNGNLEKLPKNMTYITAQLCDTDRCCPAGPTFQA